MPPLDESLYVRALPQDRVVSRSGIAMTGSKMDPAVFERRSTLALLMLSAIHRSPRLSSIRRQPYALQMHRHELFFFFFRECIGAHQPAVSPLFIIQSTGRMLYHQCFTLEIGSPPCESWLGHYTEPQIAIGLASSPRQPRLSMPYPTSTAGGSRLGDRHKTSATPASALSFACRSPCARRSRALVRRRARHPQPSYCRLCGYESQKALGCQSPAQFAGECRVRHLTIADSRNLRQY